VVLHSFKKKVEGKATKEMRKVEERLARLNQDIKEGNI
jgi:phage-related protein